MSSNQSMTQRIHSLKLTWHLPEGLLKKKLHLPTPPIFHHICHLLVSGSVSTNNNCAKKTCCFDPSFDPTTLEPSFKTPNVSPYHFAQRCDMPAVGVSFAAANLENPSSLSCTKRTNPLRLFGAIMLLQIYLYMYTIKIYMSVFHRSNKWAMIVIKILLWHINIKSLSNP